MAMDSTVGIVTGHEVGKNLDGTKDVLLLQVEISGPDDVQTVEYISSFGDMTIPPVGAEVIVIPASSSWKIAVSSTGAGDFDSSLKEGERLLFSEGGASLKLREDGKISVNGDSKTAVRFEDLEIAVNNLVTSINTAISGAITAHTHLGVTPGPSATATGTGAGPSVTVDISGAKVEEVLLP